MSSSPSPLSFLLAEKRTDSSKSRTAQLSLTPCTDGGDVVDLYPRTIHRFVANVIHKTTGGNGLATHSSKVDEQPEVERNHPSSIVDEQIVIVGAGPIGLACAISARRRGHDPLVIDSGAIVNSIADYPPQMVFFTTPELLEIGGHPFPCSGAKPTRAEAMKYYRGVAKNEGLRVHTYTRFMGASRVGDYLACEVESRFEGSRQIRCQRLILATGYFDHPRPLGVPGADLPHVTHYYDEGHRWYGHDVVVIGGRNSAVEAALDLFRSGARTAIVYRGAAFPPSVKYWMRPDIENRIAAGEIAGRLAWNLKRIDRDSVQIEGPQGQTEALPAQRVFAMTGFEPDENLFRSIGIHVADETGRPDHDPETLETNVPGVFLAGSVTAGRKTSNIFIENGRFDGEKIFSAPLLRHSSRIASKD